jgi:hypothetical protein
MDLRLRTNPLCYVVFIKIVFPFINIWFRFSYVLRVIFCFTEFYALKIFPYTIACKELLLLYAHFMP